MKQLRIILLLFFTPFVVLSQDSINQYIPSFELKEITIIKEYKFKNKSEEKKYKVLEQDLRKVYPLLTIIRKEYDRINSEINLYEGEKKKEYLKWCENHMKEKYFHLLGGLTPRQGRLLLKLIDREFDKTPYDLIKEYRNGFRAAIWNATATVFMASLRAEYKEEKNPMTEHIIQRIDMEYQATDINK